MKHYGMLPIPLGEFRFDLPEVMYYLYLPVRMTIGGRVMLPPALECCRAMIDAAQTYNTVTHKAIFKYVYLSARKGYATPDNPLNRPGWHCDGFGTEDINCVWWTGPSTRFAHQAFDGIVEDHVRAFDQFDRQVRDDSIVTYPEKNLFWMDSNVVHATPIIEPPGCFRQYVKVSLSNERYNLENNSHNYLFDYDWPLHPRDRIRNDPHRAQLDYLKDEQ